MTSNSNLTVTGLDLGSSSAKIAAVEKGGIEIITNQANFRQTPNVVGFGPNQRLVGQSGQLKINSNYSNTVTAPSRFLGFNKDCQYLKEELKFCPAKAQKGEKENFSLAFNLLYNNERQGFTAQQLLASYLTEIQKIIAHTNNLLNKNLIITVPSYFTQHERQALIDAVEICKKKLHNEYATQLINQEIAISMDYGYTKRNDFSEDLQKAHKVLFIDFGHSKTNVFVTAFNKQHLRVLANKFDRQLGCKFLDVELLKFYADYFDSAHPSLQLNLMESKKAVLKLLENIEKQRKVLSGNMDHDLSIECLLEDQDLYYSMNREQYEKICQPIIEKFKNLLRSFFNQLKHKGISFDVIELIGGGTRIPAIIRAISQVFNSEPCRTINSSECVAKGAALISAINSSIFKVQPYSFFTISPYSIELKMNGEGLGNNIIQRNEIILREKQIEVDIDSSISKFKLSAEYTDENYQNGLQKRIFECNVEILGKNIQNRNEESQMKEEAQDQNSTKIIIQIAFDQNGLIKLENIKPFSNRISIKTSNINYFPKFSRTQLALMEKQEKEMTLRDFKIKKFYEKKNQFESLIYKSKHNFETILSQNPQYVSEDKAYQIKTFIQSQQNWLNPELQLTSQTKINDFDKKEKELYLKIEQFAALVTQLKQTHLLVNSQLQKLANYLNEIISKRNQQMYPDDVKKVGQWINEVFEKQKSSPKSAPPIVSIEQIKQVQENLIKKINDFDMEMEMERQRQMNMRRGRHQRNTQGGFYRPSETSYHPYNSGRDNDDNQKPKPTRNRGYQKNSNPFGSYFGSGFF